MRHVNPYVKKISLLLPLILQLPKKVRNSAEVGVGVTLERVLKDSVDLVLGRWTALLVTCLTLVCRQHLKQGHLAAHAC